MQGSVQSVGCAAVRPRGEGAWETCLVEPVVGDIIEVSLMPTHTWLMQVKEGLI